MNKLWPYARGFLVGLAVAALAIFLAVWVVSVEPDGGPAPLATDGRGPTPGPGTPDDGTVGPDPTPDAPDDAGEPQDPDTEATVAGQERILDTAVPPDVAAATERADAAAAEYVLYEGILVAYPVRRLDEMDLVAPAWTPDGRFLSWFQHGARGTSVWVARVAYPSLGGSMRVRLPGGLAEDRARWPLVWHKDGIGVFTEGERLYFFAPGGATAAEMLPRTQVAEALSDPAIIADGNQLALSVAPGSIQIWDRLTSRLTRVSSERDNHGPAWSPDGTRLAWAQDSRGGSAVLYSWADTPEEHGVEVVVGAKARPVWLDDDTLAYFARRDGRDVVRVVRSDGDRVADFDRARPTTDGRVALLPGEEILAFSGTAEPQSRAIMLWREGWAHPVGVSTPHYDLRDIALVRQDGRVLVAYTAKEAPGAAHWSLWLSDITQAVDAAGAIAQR